MKKLFITTFLLASLHTQSIAQVYLKLGFGQGFTAAGQTAVFEEPYNGTISYSQSTNKLSTFKVKNASFGSGSYLRGAVGYMFGKHVGAELGIQVALASKKWVGVQSFPLDGNTYDDISHSMYAKSGFILDPSIVLQTGNDFNLYTRIGLILPMSINVNDDFSDRRSDMLHTDQVFRGTYEYKTMFSLGYNAALGFSLHLVKGVSIWAEGYMNSLSLDIKERKLTRLEYNSQDVLAQQSASVKDLKFSKSSGTTSGALYTYSVPFSSVGFRVGLSVSF